MPSAPIWGALIVVLVILLSVLGAIHRRERYAFVAGVLLLIIGQSVGGMGGSFSLILGVIGIAVVVASTVPLLRQPPTIE